MFWCIILLFPAIAACGSNRARSTSEMAALLEAIAADTDRNPRRNAHANKARVRSLRAVSVPESVKERVIYGATLGKELLRAGENEEAIAQFTAMLREVEEHDDVFDASYALGLKDYLAISYLRLAEEENCLDSPSAERCVLPISPGGVHRHERGSRGAIALYEELLRSSPEDLNALWLLNVAYMTLGEWPDGVRPKWRIPPEAFRAEGDIGRFVDVASALAVDVAGLSGGAVIEDFNGDSRLDIMTSSWGLRDQLRYFERTDGGWFEDRTAAAGLEGIVGGLNLVHADYDNDGAVDVFVLRGAWLGEGHPNSLLKGRGDGTFEDVTVEAGVFSAYPTQTAAWSDFDLDGDLDLFIGNESNTDAGLHPCELFRNNGDGTFSEIADEVGLVVLGYVKAVVWGDYDNDGWPDLFVSRYMEENLLYRNQGGAAFEEVGAEAGVREPLDSFPAWFWDYDNDGWEDIFVSGWRATAGDVAAEKLGLPGADEKPRLFRNQRAGTFSDVATDMGLDRVLYTMGSNYGDLNNDGWLDFYAGTGDPDFRALMPNRMFLNDAGARFLEVTYSGGFGHLQKGHGVAFGDMDDDGDQDIYMVLGGAYEGDVFHNVLFENPGHGNRWVTLELVGTTTNRSAIGSRVRLVISELDQSRTLYRTVGTGGSFGSSSLRLEIGLRRATAVEAIEITWQATGIVQRFEDIPLDRMLRLVEGESLYEVIDLGQLPFTPQKR